MSQLGSAASLEEATRLGRALPLTALPAPQGPDRLIGSIGVGFRLGGEHTGGQVAIVEHPFPPGALVPPHVHTQEDEFSIVTAGEIGFRSGLDEVVLGPGGYIVKPRGELHTMWNAGTNEARMIEAGPPNPSDLAALAKRYGVFVDGTWVPELMEKYHLNSPFG